MELYSYVPPLGAVIPISVELFLVDDLVPMEDKINWAVKRLHNHRYGGLSEMRAEHLKMWLAAAEKVAKDETRAGAEHLQAC